MFLQEKMIVQQVMKNKQFIQLFVRKIVCSCNIDKSVCLIACYTKERLHKCLL